ncbi:glycosyltransferase [Actinomyces lilanjuaniae]|uniref:Glycosyltransferase n=1 Tax=Actinomyces lilanjuaniae TaxID=2321394 RepID=A0ABM6Z4K5_9ACTO|nr:glycosyltransferase [Actinomyces lilanjuaniae]AYD90266.1 glycosyltransferase [Actinomyces lilanjuaniae]
MTLVIGLLGIIGRGLGGGARARTAGPRPAVRRGGVLLASRIHLPEAAAASFRLDGVERALAGRGVPVRVLTTTPPRPGAVGSQEPAGNQGGGALGSAPARVADTPAPPDPQGVTVSRWPALRDRSGYLRGYLPYMSFDVPLLLRALTAPRPDVVLVEPPPTTGAVVRLVSALRRLPYVWYAPDVWSAAAASTGAPGLVVRAVRALESFAVKGASSVVAVNEDVAQAVRDLGARQVRVVLNGVDTSVFSADGPAPTPQEKEELGITGPYFVYAGTASEWQGAGVFAQAVARVRCVHPTAQVLFLGQGSDWEAISETAATIPVGPDGAPAVVMHPLMPPTQAARWQRGAVACLVSIRPGLGYDFAYPTKVLAALSCGTPVLYAGRGPVVEDVTGHDLGWACDHDPQAVASAMAEALEEDTRLASTQERAGRAHRLHRWVEEYRSMSATGRAVADLLRTVVLDARSLSR